jgi:hypothetical protein
MPMPEELWSKAPGPIAIPPRSADTVNVHVVMGQQ